MQLLLFTPVSITPLIDTEDACFDLNASRPIAKGDLKWRDALLVAHRVNSNMQPARSVQQKEAIIQTLYPNNDFQSFTSNYFFTFIICTVTFLLLILCYCSHDVRPATHLAILNRLWRWGEMHSSQNTHPPCQSAE